MFRRKHCVTLLHRDVRVASSINYGKSQVEALKRELETLRHQVPLLLGAPQQCFS